MFSSPSKIKAAYITEDIAGAISANDSLAWELAGEHVVYRGVPIAVLGTTSYAPYAQAVIASGANVAFETLASSDAIGLAAAFNAAGFKGAIKNRVTYYPRQLTSQPNEAPALNHEYAADVFPANENDTPAVKQDERALASIGQKPDLASGVCVGYWSAALLEQMLRATLQREGGDPSKVHGGP